MQTIHIGHVVMTIPKYFEFRKQSDPHFNSYSVFCSLRDMRTGNAENFAVSYMDSNANIEQRIKILIDKLEKRNYMSSPLSSYADNMINVQQEMSYITNQVSSLKKQNKKLLLLT